MRSERERTSARKPASLMYATREWRNRYGSHCPPREGKPCGATAGYMREHGGMRACTGKISEEIASGAARFLPTRTKPSQAWVFAAELPRVAI